MDSDSQQTLFSHESAPGDEVRIAVDPGRRGAAVDERLFGKFAEHLGRNVDKGMCAQTLVNPTFGPWEFPADPDHPDGGIRPEHDPDAIRAAIRDYCEAWAVPNPDALADTYLAGGAFGWATVGEARVSPDRSPEGDRAQRVNVRDGAGGLLQRTHLPLHRTDWFELAVRLRATTATPVTVGVYAPGADPTEATPLAATTVTADREWTTHEADLTVDGEGTDAPDDAAYTVAVTVEGDRDLVLDRLTLYPDDHVRGADPEIVERLREADLPVLRWPGGNFVSGYRWEDGVGPVDERRSRVNPAWGRGEPALFGTAEFVAFCREVGCEPMICVNAGGGTPEEAARWVEYCNGDTDTEMGALRAEHGHPEPFDVPYWEVGNELFGSWQVGWTTPSGNGDRYRQFREAMLAVDPDIELLACGNRNSPGDRWDDALLGAAGPEVSTITDHVLAGGTVDAGTDPDDLFHAFMGYADQLGETYRDLRDRMRAASIEDPSLAITELQLFAHFEENREIDHHGGGLTPETMPTRQTVSEPLYLATIVHECVRMGEFVDHLTHSATVNHGGGLRKHRERTWADPAHYGHVLLSALAGGTPLGLDVACDTVTTDESFGDISAIEGLPVVDAIAVETDDACVLTFINRRSGDAALDLTLDLSALDLNDDATITTLAAEEMYAENTAENPERVAPETESVAVDDGRLTTELPPYSLTRLVVPRR